MLTVLVADDHGIVREGLVRLLESDPDIRVCGQAADGREVLEQVERHRPDVVLLDIGLPRMNGHEAARWIREQPWGRGMLLVALTGWGQDEDRRRSSAVGFDHHLVKPVEIAELLDLLAKAPGA